MLDKSLVNGTKVQIAMNARTHVFELSVEGHQIEEVVASIFHTLLFQRSYGKFNYKQDDRYIVDSLGFEEVTCDFIDCTYIRCDSDDLNNAVMKEIRSFSESLRSTDRLRVGKISIEFYQRKQSRWLMPAETIPWEIWTLKLNIISLPNEHERQIHREKLAEILSEKLFAIGAAMMKHEDYIPKMPARSELDQIFDTSFPDVQPYLFKISYQSSNVNNPSVGNTVRKLIKDTLSS